MINEFFKMFDFLFKKKTAELPELFFHTDVHCHIMPGVDHGSPDEDTSLKLIEGEQSWGINRIVLTSHVTESTFENNPQTLAAGFDRLVRAVKAVGNSIKLAYSAEYRIDSLFMEQYKAGQLVKFPDDYLLVENSFVQEPWGLDNLLFDLKISGFKPIMAHPERFGYYHDDKKRYDALHQAGNLFQVNLLSLAGYHGTAPKKVAEWLVEQGYADFLGTDMHNMTHFEAIDKYLRSKDFKKLMPLLEKTVKNDTIKF